MVANCWLQCYFPVVVGKIGVRSLIGCLQCSFLVVTKVERKSSIVILVERIAFQMVEKIGCLVMSWIASRWRSCFPVGKVLLMKTIVHLVVERRMANRLMIFDFQSLMKLVVQCWQWWVLSSSSSFGFQKINLIVSHSMWFFLVEIDFQKRMSLIVSYWQYYHLVEKLDFLVETKVAMMSPIVIPEIDCQSQIGHWQC